MLIEVVQQQNMPPFLVNVHRSIRVQRSTKRSYDCDIYYAQIEPTHSALF